MKIGGRIIQDSNIESNTEFIFQATYKKHYINVSLIKSGGRNSNNEYDIDVRHFDGGFAVMAIITRCSIRDAIIYALDGAML